MWCSYAQTTLSIGSEQLEIAFSFRCSVNTVWTIIMRLSDRQFTACWIVRSPVEAIWRKYVISGPMEDHEFVLSKLHKLPMRIWLFYPIVTFYIPINKSPWLMLKYSDLITRGTTPQLHSIASNINQSGARTKSHRIHSKLGIRAHKALSKSLVSRNIV